MRLDEMVSGVEEGMAVDSHDVALAKEYVMSQAAAVSGGTYPTDRHSLDAYASHLGFPMINEFMLDQDDAACQAQLAQAKGYHRARLAMVEAVWSLVGNGQVIPSRDGLEEILPIQRHKGRGGDSGARFENHKYTVPLSVSLAPSLRSNRKVPLTNPDLFVLDSGIAGAHEEVEEALRDAISCFRFSLYRPAVTMLGKAMEGAWIELGLALANAGVTPASTSVEGFKDDIQSTASIGTKMGKVRDAFASIRNSHPVKVRAGIPGHELESAWAWSDVVRETRNAIHFGNSSTIAHTYEGVAILLMAASTHLGIMYSIKRAADAEGLGG